jgi:hypothetical protein
MTSQRGSRTNLLHFKTNRSDTTEAQINNQLRPLAVIAFRTECDFDQELDSVTQAS